MTIQAALSLPPTLRVPMSRSLNVTWFLLWVFKQMCLWHSWGAVSWEKKPWSIRPSIWCWVVSHGPGFLCVGATPTSQVRSVSLSTSNFHVFFPTCFKQHLLVLYPDSRLLLSYSGAFHSTIVPLLKAWGEQTTTVLQVRLLPYSVCLPSSLDFFLISYSSLCFLKTTILSC